MAERKAEQAGWTWGWTGGFLWVAILAAVFLAQGKLAAAGSGLLLFALALWFIRRYAPWRYPRTPYWRLYLGPYALFLLTIPWAIWAFGGIGDERLNGWMLLWLLPVLTPIVINGRRTWADGATGSAEDN